MLVLSRRADQSIELPGLGIAVKVLRVKGNTVRLGISAPDDVRIIRQELSFEAEPAPAPTPSCARLNQPSVSTS